MPPTPEQNPQTDATHRLNRIIVQEVSLVDRAANKRRFLVVKRDEPMAKPVKKEDAAAATADVADQTAADGAGGAGASDGAGASGTGMQQQVKEGLTAGLADIAEKIVALANQVDQTPVTDQPADPAVPADVTKQIGDIATALTDLATKFGGAAAAADASGGDSTTDGSAVAASDGGTTPAPAGDTTKAKDPKEEEPTDAEKAAVKDAEEETAKKGLDVAKSRDLVTKSVAKRLNVQLPAAAVIVAKVEKIEVAKVGRRMAKKRLEQLGKAIDMLIGLMKELRYDAPKPPVGKTATTKSEAAPADVTALLKNAEALLEVSKATGAELATARAELATAHARIAKLEKTTGGSNVIALEKSGGGEAGGSVSWPMDMNQRGARAAAK